MAVPFVLHSQPTTVLGDDGSITKMAKTAHQRYAEIMRDIEQLIKDHSKWPPSCCMPSPRASRVAHATLFIPVTDLPFDANDTDTTLKFKVRTKVLQRRQSSSFLYQALVTSSHRLPYMMHSCTRTDNGVSLLVALFHHPSTTFASYSTRHRSSV